MEMLLHAALCLEMARMLPHTALQLEFARNAGMPGKTSQRGPVRFASEDALGLSWGILSATLARGHSN